MNLQLTSHALRNLPPNRRFSDGSHVERREEVGTVGIRAADIEFDASEHEQSQINPTSFLGEIFKRPHVSQVQHSRKLQTNIVIGPINEQDDPRIAYSKRAAGLSIANLLRSSLLQNSDGVNNFVYGYEKVPDKDNSFNPHVEIIKDVPHLAEVCRRGLTFVISDFVDMRKELAGVPLTSGGIGVMINHPAELEVGPKDGILSVGGGREVNTAKPDELNWFNSNLAQYQGKLVTDVQATGLRVAQIVVNPHTVTGYSIPEVDKSIAGAVESL